MAFLKPGGFWNNIFHGTFKKKTGYFFICHSAQVIFHSLQVENCDSNSRLVVDEDDNGKLGLKRVNGVKHNKTREHSTYFHRDLLITLVVQFIGLFLFFGGKFHYAILFQSYSKVDFPARPNFVSSI